MSIDLNKEKNEMKYYYSDNGTTLGPFSLTQLLEKIEGETLVYREGIEWTNAKDIEELKKFFKVKKVENVYTSDNASIHSDNSNDVNSNPFIESKKMFAAPFSFEGRIRRTEYGVSLIIYVFAYAILMNIVKTASIVALAYIPLFWFIWAQGAKRCHDRNNSGWYQIIPFYVLWMLFAEGENFINNYGTPSKN